MRKTLLFVGLCLVIGCSPAEKTKDRDVTITDVKLTQLESEIAKQKGKVVVLDIWADFCLPCKKEFPHLVKMNEKYKGDKVVCMSVSIDKAERKEDALKFLKAKGASFNNYWLSDGPEAATKKWEFETIPTVVVFGTDGKLAKRFTDEFGYSDVNALVEKLVK